MDDAEKPHLLTSEIAYHGRLFDVVVDTIALPHGVTAVREIIRHPGAAGMIPVLDDGRIVCVTQYRHAAGSRLLEIPAGTVDKGETPLETAARELEEETGLHAGRIEPFGGLFVAAGYTSEYIHLFVCRDLTPSRTRAGDEDEDIEIETLSLDECLTAIEDGRIRDAKSQVGLLRYARRLGR